MITEIRLTAKAKLVASFFQIVKTWRSLNTYSSIGTNRSKCFAKHKNVEKDSCCLFSQEFLGVFVPGTVVSSGNERLLRVPTFGVGKVKAESRPEEIVEPPRPPAQPRPSCLRPRRPPQHYPLPTTFGPLKTDKNLFVSIHISSNTEILKTSIADFSYRRQEILTWKNIDWM